MSDKHQVPLIELMTSLSLAMDLVSRAVARHHVRVGFFSARLAHTLGLPADVQRDLLLAGMIHDAGALSLQSRLDALEFETDGKVHAEAGYRLASSYPRLSRVAEYIRYHHTSYPDVQASGGRIPIESNVVHLADRIDVLIKRGKDIASQLPGIQERIKAWSGTHFDPEYVEAFFELCRDPETAFEAERPERHLRTLTPERLECEGLPYSEVIECTRLFSLIIDFRSSFTATHSSGVAATSTALARIAGFSEQNLELMHIAGNLHDLGKLAVPREILDKPGPLDDDEWAVMKQHPELCRNVLGHVSGLNDAVRWAADHHERLDGKGYPEGIDGERLTEGSRIMAVCDVFTAITEDRPYREGMSREKAAAVLENMADTALDGDVVSELIAHYDELNEVRRQAQQEASDEFSSFYTPEQTFSN